MNENDLIEIQNLYDFTDSSKQINEFKLVDEVRQICFSVRVVGEESTKIHFNEVRGMETMPTTVDALSQRYKAIIVIVMVIMGEDREDVSKLFFRQGFKKTASILKEIQINYEIPKSVREFREKFIERYCG